MNTASATARAKDDTSRSAFTMAGFSEFQIERILGGPEPGATTSDHLLALLCTVDADFALNRKLLKNKLLKTTTPDGSEPSCGYTVQYQIASLLAAPDRETAASCLRALLQNTHEDPWALDDGLDFVTAQIRRSAGKKPRLKH